MDGFDPKQLQEMMAAARRQYDVLAHKMQETIVEATSGGGSVTVRMNGHKQVLSIVIDPEAVKAGDIEMLQDLVTAAVNSAVQKVDEAMNVGNMLSGLQGLL